MMDKIQQLAAQAALTKMVRGGHLCICTIDQVLKLSGGVPDARDYEILRTLHCVHFKDMPPELLREVPSLIKNVINAPSLDLDIDRVVVELRQIGAS